MKSSLTSCLFCALSLVLYHSATASVQRVREHHNTLKHENHSLDSEPYGKVLPNISGQSIPVVATRHRALRSLSNDTVIPLALETNPFAIISLDVQNSQNNTAALDKTAALDDTAALDNPVALDNTVALDKTAALDTSEALDKTAVLDNAVALDNTVALDTSEALDKTAALDNTEKEESR